jgi:hypothetical protein
MPKPSSAVWLYGKKKCHDLVVCNTCQREVKCSDGNTKNFDCHLWRHHEIDALGKRTQPSKTVTRQPKLNLRKSTSLDVNNNTMGCQPATNPVPSVDSHHPPHPSVFFLQQETLFLRLAVVLILRESTL